MATEQDWAAYTNQSVLNDTDTLLGRTSAGAGVEIPGSAFLKKDASGNSNLALGAPTAAGGVRYFDIYNQENTSGASGAVLRLITYNAAGSSLIAANLVKYKSGLFYISNDEAGSGGAIAFGTGGTERARIDNGGRLLVGTTSPLAGTSTHEFKVTGSNVWPLTTNGVDRALLCRCSSPTSGIYVYFEYNGGTNNGSISFSGGGVSYNTSSDYRLKTDIKPLTGCLDRILDLPVWDFLWTTTGTRGHGFMAHEYGAVVNNGATGVKDGEREEEYIVEPERVTDVLGPDGNPIVIPEVKGLRMVPDYQGIDQAKVTPYLVGAVQELSAMVDALRAEVDALKAAKA